MGPASSGVVRRHLLPDEAAQTLQILAVQFNVIVSRSLHPQRLHRLGAALEQSQAVGEVDHLVVCPVDNQHRGRDFRNLLDAKEKKKKKGRSCVKLSACDEASLWGRVIRVNNNRSCDKGQLALFRNNV